jgi:hypothetical protein
MVAGGKGLMMLVVSGVTAGLASQFWALMSLCWSGWLLWITGPLSVHTPPVSPARKRARTQAGKCAHLMKDVSSSMRVV